MTEKIKKPTIVGKEKDKQITVSFEGTETQIADLIKKANETGITLVEQEIEAEEMTDQEIISDLSAQLERMKAELESQNTNPIENEEFVQDFLAWAESKEGREELQGGHMWYDKAIDLTGLNRKVLVTAAMDMAICYIMPGKTAKSFETCLKKHLAIEKANNPA